MSTDELAEDMREGRLAGLEGGCNRSGGHIVLEGRTWAILRAGDGWNVIEIMFANVGDYA